MPGPTDPTDDCSPPLAEQAFALWQDAPDALIVLDAQWRYQYLNPAARQLLDLGDEVLGVDSRTVHPDVPTTAFGAAYSRVMLARAAETVEHHYEPLDTYLRARVMPLSGGGLLISLVDVTQERRPQARLSRSLDLVQQVLDHMSAAISLRDLQTRRYLLVNRAAAVRLGRSVDAIVGRTAEDVLPPDLAAALTESDDEVQRTGQSQDPPWEHALTPESRLLAESFPVRDRDGTMIGIGTTVADVTALTSVQADLAAAEVELAASQQRFRRVFGSTSLGILILAADGRILEANSSMCGLLGYSRAHLTTMNGLDLIPTPQTGYDDRRARIRAEAEHGYEIEEKFRRSDGQLLPVLLTVNSFDDPAGRGRLISCVVRDLTKLHELQGQLVQAERMEAVGRLAASIVHDSNNILTAVSGYAEMLQEEIADNPMARRHLSGIMRSVQHAGQLVDRLMAFTSGRPQPAALVLDLAALVHELEDMLRHMVPPGITLSLVLQPTWVVADPLQIRQIVVNLVANARNALGESGSIEVSVSPSADAAMAELSVRDDGPGMAPDVAARCFDPFFSTRKEAGGTGLGLSTAQNLARQSGGDLQLSTSPGGGCAFTLSLPLADGRAESAAEPAVRPVLSILVVDDDPLVREFVVVSLRAAGHVVTVAGNGLLALEASAEVDLVVSDIDMPEMGGLELADRLADERPELPVLLVSGTTAPPPGRAFLAKPFSHGALLEAVQGAMRGARR